jgi:predicted transcriptional regulator
MPPPRQYDEPLTRAISIRVTDAHYRQLHEIAAQNQVPMRTFIRQAIDEAVSDCREVAVFRIPDQD